MNDTKTQEVTTELPAVKEITPETVENLPYIPPAAGHVDMLLDERLFSLGQRAAKLFAASDIVPQKYKGNMANCFIAIHLARNLQVDPFMFMKNCYFVGGEPELEGKLVIALINSRGPYKDGVRFTEFGQGDDYAVTAWGKRADGEIDSASLSVKRVKQIGWYSKNPWWQNLTKEMLEYRTATMLARVHCPQVLMGLNTPGETIDSGSAVTVMPVQELNKNLGLKADRKDLGNGPVQAEPITMEDEQDGMGKSSGKVQRSRSRDAD